VSDARGRAEAALEGLVGKGLLGAALVGRDGLPVLARLPAAVQPETFCAMAAALVGAAEAALLEVGEKADATASIIAGGHRLAVAGLDDRHLLVLLAPASLADAALAGAIAGGRKSLADILGG
jgi:predicted regulator of Ras-like GTPase activity (Roadblock/LC7/MglB family)